MTLPSEQHPTRSLRLGWLSTGRGPGSRGLLAAVQKAIQDQNLSASIDFVFCNRDPGEAEGSDAFLEQVASYNIPALTLSFRRFRREYGDDPGWRDRYNSELIRILREHPVDLLVLAGFLLILDEAVIDAFPALNLHPAAPDGPVGTWQEVVWELIRQEAQETGAMTQLATADLDRGPVLAYCRFPVRGPRFDSLWKTVGDRSVKDLRESEGEGNGLFQAIREEEVRREVPLLLATLKAVAEGQITIEDGSVHGADGEILSEGLDITDEIEAMVAAQSPS